MLWRIWKDKLQLDEQSQLPFAYGYNSSKCTEVKWYTKRMGVWMSYMGWAMMLKNYYGPLYSNVTYLTFDVLDFRFCRRSRSLSGACSPSWNCWKSLLVTHYSCDIYYRVIRFKCGTNAIFDKIKAFLLVKWWRLYKFLHTPTK